MSFNSLKPAFLDASAAVKLVLKEHGSDRLLEYFNPAGSFFYLLTAMHGLHVAGGLVGWAVTILATWRNADPARVARLTVLCARYWHFLLAVWIVLFVALGWVTPELIRTICGTR